MKNKQGKLKEKLEQKRKLAQYSIMCALFIKQVRAMSNENLLNWFTVMNKTDGLCDEFVLLFRDMVKKCLLDEYEKRKSKGEMK